MRLENQFATAQTIADASGGNLSEERARFYLKEVRSTPAPRIGRGSRARLYAIADVLPFLQPLAQKKMWSDAATTALISASKTIEQYHKKDAA